MITTDQHIRQFLSSKDVPCYQIEPLSGGCSNYTWRVRTLLGRRSIVKHAEGYVRLTPEVSLSAKRLNFEHAALTTVPDLIPADADVRIPQVYHFFPDEHVLNIADGGMQTLKDGYINDETIDVPVLGSRIGTWLATLHNVTSATDRRANLQGKFDSRIAKSLTRTSYTHLGSILEYYGHDPNLGERIDEKFGSQIATDAVCLCHGDFWPGNFLLEDVRDDEQIHDPTRAPVLTIADWELVRIGNGATDVGQFMAQAWLMDRLHGGRGLMDSFLDAYLKERPLSEKDRIKAAVHFGVHITFHAPTECSENFDQATEIVNIGKDLLEAIHLVRPEKLRNGPLKVLFERERE